MIEPQRNKMIKERKIKMDMDKIYKAAGFIATTIVSIGISQLIELLPNANGVVNTIVIVALALACCYLIIKLHDDKANSSEKFNSETQKCEKEMNDLKDKLAEYEKRLVDSEKMSEVFDVDKGGAYLLMSLTQNLNEPLKIKYLEKASEEYNNELASLILANLYSSGIENNGVILLEQNREKAANIYRNMVDGKFDKHGVASWQMGIYYENNLIEEAGNLPDDNERYEKAVEYYKVSAEKNFGKAFNSLAKFHKTMNLRVLEHDENMAEIEYAKASEYGDVYATINLGIVLKEKYQKATKISDKATYLDEARQKFEKAIEFECSEAYYQLADVYRILASDESMILDGKDSYYYVKKSAKCCIDVISRFNNKFSAAAYYVLGKLISEHENLPKDVEIKKIMVGIASPNLADECFTRSLNQLKSLNRSTLKGVYQDYYKELEAKFDKESK